MAPFEMTHSYDQALVPSDFSMLRVPVVYAIQIDGQSASLTLNIMLRENAPRAERRDEYMCFLLKHRAIITITNSILLLKPSFVI